MSNAASQWISVGGRLCRPGARLLAIVLVAWAVLGAPDGPAYARGEDEVTAPSPEDWRKRLREHTDDFATARLRQREAREAIESGDSEQALQLLSEATNRDPRYHRPQATRAAIYLKRGDFSGINEVYEAARDRVAGYRNQSISLSNLLLTLDIVLIVALVWCTLALLIRYLPFIHHRLAQRLLSEAHRRRRARLLWPAVLAPLLAVASWGLVPALALAIPFIWVHADRQGRAALGLILLVLAAQGAWTRPFAAVLAGTDPSSLPALVERAAYEPPTETLRMQLRERLEHHPHDADLLLAEGLLLARRGDFEASSRVLLDHLERRPADVTATNNLAANHFFLGDVDRAVSGFQRAAALDTLESVPHYNLSQAYLQKLFLKEGGQAQRAAMARGFALTEQVERLPQGAVYFLRPSLADYWRLAWIGTGDLDPFAVIGGRVPGLGVPADHVGTWFASILGVSVFLGLVVPRRRLVFECVNCGALACRHCRGEHEGAVLCSGCAQTARRAKSEVVLTTLLRNRRRDAEAAYQKRMERVDAWLPGAGALADGVRTRGVISTALVSLGVTAVVLGAPPLIDAWDIVSTSLFGPVRIAGAALIVVVFLLNTVGRPSVRGRHLQPHPSSAVSLAGLIEGRGAERARVGG